MLSELSGPSDGPLASWLRQARLEGGVPLVSGRLLLSGNASAHEHDLSAALREAAASSDARYLLESAAWQRFSCASGCSQLIDQVSDALHQRAGLWTVIFVSDAERAPTPQLAALVSRFWRQAQCVHSNARLALNVDCRRCLFVLSTSWAAHALSEAQLLSSLARPREWLREVALRDASQWITAIDAASPPARRSGAALRQALVMSVGEPSSRPFEALIAQQTAQRQVRWVQQGKLAPVGDRANAPRPPAEENLLRPLENLVGQPQVVASVRSRLASITTGAAGRNQAHVFFFYGFPGTGKSYLAELIAEARHGTTKPPFYAKFAMQNYRTDEDLWRLFSPPCGVKGEGAFAALFAHRLSASAAEASIGGSHAPVVVLDEIEEARADVMTTALVNAIDQNGFVEYTTKAASDADGLNGCQMRHASTGGAIFVLTSNCFLEPLRRVWESKVRSHASLSDAYTATRAEMDRLILHEGIACDEHGRASPLAPPKMRDRMIGNLYPFLPLGAEEMARAFEMELERRAESYAATSGVSLFWTAEFTRLAMLPRDSGAAALTIRPVAARPTASQHGRGGEVLQAGGNGAGGMELSVRKRIDVLMRLDDASVEQLYVRGVERCGGVGSRTPMNALVLYVAHGAPRALPFCSGDVDERRSIHLSAKDASLETMFDLSVGPVDDRQVHGGDEKPPRMPPRPPEAAQVAVGAHGEMNSPGAGPARAISRIAQDSHGVVERRSSAPRAQDAAVSSELEAALEREAALVAEVHSLRAEVEHLRATMRQWQLLCALLTLALLAVLLASSYVAILYAVQMVKIMCMTATMAALVTATVTFVLTVGCRLGSRTACNLQELTIFALRSFYWLLLVSVRLLAQAVAAFGVYGTSLFILLFAPLAAYAVRRARRRHHRLERLAALEARWRIDLEGLKLALSRAEGEMAYALGCLLSYHGNLETQSAALQPDPSSPVLLQPAATTEIEVEL